MPFPKEWDSKPKILVYPVRRNNALVCHNCYQGWPRDMINSCTGLCTMCIKENPVPIETLNSAANGSDKPRCQKCSNELKYTNFGILRRYCHSCKVDNRPLKQRCLVCDKFFKDCWNHVCRRCRFRRELCEETGYFYANRDHHRRHCWCLKHDDQLKRQAMLMQRQSTSTASTSAATSSITNTSEATTSATTNSGVTSNTI